MKFSTPREQLSANFQIKVETGLNRFVWDLRYEGASSVPGYYLYEYRDGAKGPLALPGQYQVRLTVNGKSQTAAFELKLDPRVHIAQADLDKQFKLLTDIRDELSRIYDTVNQIEDVRSQVDGLKKRLPDTGNAKTVMTAGNALDDKLITARDQLINLKITANEDSLAYPPQIDAKLAYLAMAVGRDTDSTPTESAYREFDKLKKQADDLLARWAELQKTDVAAFQKLATDQGIQAIVVPASAATPSSGAEPR